MTRATGRVDRVIGGAGTAVDGAGSEVAFTVEIAAASGTDEAVGTAEAATATLAVAARVRTMRATNNGRAQTVVGRTGRWFNGSSR
jgi:hypothetical protein